MKKKRNPIRWTSEADAELAHLLEKRWTYRQIAKHMGRTFNSVKCRCHQLGLKATHRDDFWSREAIDFLVDHYRRQGWTAERIGEQVGRSASSVFKKANLLGLTDPETDYKAKPEPLQRQALLLAARDYTLLEIAEALNVSRDWARRVINASPYYRRLYKDRESFRRSHGQQQRRRAAA